MNPYLILGLGAAFVAVMIFLPKRDTGGKSRSDLRKGKGRK